MIKLEYTFNNNENWGLLLEPWIKRIKQFVKCIKDNNLKEFRFTKENKKNDTQSIAQEKTKNSEQQEGSESNPKNKTPSQESHSQQKTNISYKIDEPDLSEIINILSNEDIVQKILLFKPNSENALELKETIEKLARVSQNEKYRDLLCELFNYNDFSHNYCRTQWSLKEDGITIISKSDRKTKILWCKKSMEKMLNIHSCVYCNLQYYHQENYNIRFLDSEMEDDSTEENHEDETHSTKLGKSKSKIKEVPYYDYPNDMNWFKTGRYYEKGPHTKSYCSGALDHIFAKDKYPFLQISPFNLVPSCTLCNSIKHDKDFPYGHYLHPFEDSFHDIAHFMFDFTDVTCLSTPQKGSVKVRLEEKLIQNTPKDKDKDEDKDKNAHNKIDDFTRAKNFCDFFGLTDRISKGHSDYICEILVKLIEYNKEYNSHLQEKFNIPIDDVERFIFGNYTKTKDINKRPLAKVTIDMKRQYEHYIWTDEQINKTLQSLEKKPKLSEYLQSLFS